MLITCPECLKEVSDRASICPSCGFPNPANPAWNNPEELKKEHEKRAQEEHEKRTQKAQELFHKYKARIGEEWGPETNVCSTHLLRSPRRYVLVRVELRSTCVELWTWCPSCKKGFREVRNYDDTYAGS